MNDRLDQIESKIIEIQKSLVAINIENNRLKSNLCEIVKGQLLSQLEILDYLENLLASDADSNTQKFLTKVQRRLQKHLQNCGVMVMDVTNQATSNLIGKIRVVQTIPVPPSESCDRVHQIIRHGYSWELPENLGKRTVILREAEVITTAAGRLACAGISDPRQSERTK